MLISHITTGKGELRCAWTSIEYASDVLQIKQSAEDAILDSNLGLPKKLMSAPIENFWLLNHK